MPCALKRNEGFKQARGVFLGVNVTFFTVSAFTVFTAWPNFF